MRVWRRRYIVKARVRARLQAWLKRAVRLFFFIAVGFRIFFYFSIWSCNVGIYILTIEYHYLVHNNDMWTLEA